MGIPFLKSALIGRLAKNLKNLSSLPRFLRGLWAVAPHLVIIIVTLRAIRALQPAALLYVAKLVVDEVIRIAASSHADLGLSDILPGGPLSSLAMLIALEFLLVAGANALARFGSLAENLLSERHNNTASARLILHAASLDLKGAESAEFQDQQMRARNQTIMGNGLLILVLNQAQEITTVVSLLGGLLFFMPSLTLLIFAALIPSLFAEFHFNSIAYSITKEATEKRRQMEYVRFIGGNPEAAKEVKLFGLGSFLANRFTSIANDLHSRNRKLSIKRTSWGTALGAIGSLAYYAAYGIIALNAAKGAISIGDLTFLAGSLLRLNGSLERLLMSFAQLQNQARYLNDLFHFMDLRSSMPVATSPTPFPSLIKIGIEFDRVGFRYPGKESWVVRNLSFKIAAGQTFALVGENGAGKTTIVKLLTRLYDPDEGRILIDGIDLREFDLDDLRNHMGAIFQDFFRYNLSVTENIAVGRIEQAGKQELIIRAARQSGAEDMIEKLPSRYDQLLGRSFAQGIDLSGGEWQKLAISRAYFRASDILILDEPTAALDARAEAEVFSRFKDLGRSSTTVLISHRFSSVRSADGIIVLENGTIIESGTHDELMARDGRYAELFSLQAAGFV